MKAYLDNNATTMVAPEVIESMKPYWTERYGNPSSIHSFGGNIAKDITKAREQVAELINASPEEIFFTSGGTESDNLAIKGVIEKNSKGTTSKKHIVTTTV